MTDLMPGDRGDPIELVRPDNSAQWQRERRECYRTLIPEHNYVFDLGEFDGWHFWQCGRCGHSISTSVELIEQ